MSRIQFQDRQPRVQAAACISNDGILLAVTLLNLQSAVGDGQTCDGSVEAQLAVQPPLVDCSGQSGRNQSQKPDAVGVSQNQVKNRQAKPGKSSQNPDPGVGTDCNINPAGHGSE